MSKKKSTKKAVRSWCHIALIAFVGTIGTPAVMIISGVSRLNRQAFPFLLAELAFMSVFAIGNLHIGAYNRSRKRSEQWLFS